MKASTISATFILLLFIAAQAEEDPGSPRVSYITDSSTDRQPALTAFPNYPAIARRDRIEGEATVCFRIDQRGKVKRASISEYTHKIFRRAALRAMRKSTFEALRPGQLAAKEKACRTYRFRLEPIPQDQPQLVD